MSTPSHSFLQRIVSRRRISRRFHRSLIYLSAIATSFVLIAGYSLARYRDTERSPLRTTKYPENWIQTESNTAHTAYFRKRFDLTSQVRHAWIKIIGKDSFEITVNRNPLGRIYLWRPTRPFQNGSSEKGQVLLPQDPAMALNFPREYQWDGHDTWRLPTYVELTSSLQIGKNVITVEIESRGAPAKVAFVGQIELWDGRIIPIESDETWLAEPTPIGPQLLDWTELYYWDKDWRHAVLSEPPINQGFRSHPEELFSRPFTGSWLRHPQVDGRRPLIFRADWTIDAPIDEAYLRVLTNRGYELFINNHRVRVASIRPPDLDNGNWVFGRGAAHDPTTKPELLDPDEVGSSFIGTRFESPRKADAQLGEFRRPFSPQLRPFLYIRTYNRAQDPGIFDPKRTLAESRRTPETPDLFPEKPRPNALKRDLSTGGYLGYSVANLLKVGKNRIELRCLGSGEANWQTQIAVDGSATLNDGTTIDFVQDENWKVLVANEPLTERPALAIGQASQAGQSLPRMQYRGVALSPESFSHILPVTLVQLTSVTVLSLASILCVAWLMSNGDPLQHHDWRLVHATTRTLTAMLLTATVTIGTGLLLECSWTERHEILWFMDGTAWSYVFPFAFWMALAVGLIDTVGRMGLTRTRERARIISQGIRDLPHSRIWFHLVLWGLLLGALVRGYKLDLQPLDDDEYASTQAVLAIMETGAPGFVPEDVFYTRSPFYHYVTAMVALPFGSNLWSFRLQSVAWGVGTAWLVYLCGSHLLGSRWVGFFGMLLVCLHPFEIFTGHVIRFYQMQQFFALLTIYCFCRGFVSDQSQRYRVATLIVFLVAVLSQEITVAMGPILVLGYILFAKDLGWSKNITLVIVSVVVVMFIGLDFIVFKTLCLTRTEGVSPSIEAAVKPHFWYPMNLFSMFIGYSRLHVVASFFFFAGLPLIWKEGNRNTLAFVAFLGLGILFTNVLVTNVSLRYMYWLFPVWMLLCIDMMRLLLSTLVSMVYPPERHLNRYVTSVSICFAICFLAILLSWSPWRIPGSYELRILGDSTGAMRWVRSQKRPGDRIAVTEPHTHCAFLEGGKCDYDIALPLLYDFAVMRDGILVDRNGGGEVVSSVDQLLRKFSEGERVWVLLNREKFRTRGKNMRWEYPGARFEQFIRQNCELKHRSYLWSVYLWDPARGHYRPFRLQE